MKNVKIILFTFVAILGITDNVLSDPPSEKNWKLIWSDEFNGEVINSTKWNYFNGWGMSPWREAYYSSQDAYLDNGNLVIRSRIDNNNFKTSGLISRTKFEQRYGYFEISAKMTELEALGQWVAFWLFVDDPHNYDGNPATGVEIDIMEYPVGWDTDLPSSGEKTTSGVIWSTSPWRQVSHKPTTPELREGFHTFGLEWNENEYSYYIDGTKILSTDKGISHTEQWILLTLEIMAGFSNLDPEIHDMSKYTHLLPDYWFVDYVRVYEVLEDTISQPTNLRIIE